MTNFHGDEAKKNQNGRLKKQWGQITDGLPEFKKKKKIASSLRKLVRNYVLEWMGLNFYYYDGLQPEMRAGIINEHECTSTG